MLKFIRAKRWLNTIFGCQHRTYKSDNNIYGFKIDKSVQCGNERLLANPGVDKNLFMFIEAYRNHGHKKASYDPLGLQELCDVPALEPGRYGITIDNSMYNIAGLVNLNGKEKASGAEVVKALEEMYCGPLSIELQHIPHTAERDWFSRRFEEVKATEVSNAEREDLAKLLLKAQAFDHFVANKFSTVKRYGGEGAESAMAFYSHLFSTAAQEGISDVVVCIPHRGRLNLLTCLMEFPPEALFRKMQGKCEFPEGVAGTGDVLSHFSNSVDLSYDGKPLHVTMLPNPSQLEAVNPVAVGKTRSKMQCLKVGDYAEDENAAHSVLCLQVHGDAAFAAQGVVAETFALGNVPHFNVGGSVHIIVNNQIGYTTEQNIGRSSLYTSCVGKINNCPVIRVNADYPEEVVKACQLAVEYRQKFKKDVIVDYICYRRWGHNEVDEPAFTQPLMYGVIRNRKSIPDTYTDTLVEAGVCSTESLQSSVQTFNTQLTEAFNGVSNYIPKADHLESQWSGLVQASDQITTWDTGVDPLLLKYVGAKSVILPQDFNVHPTLKKTHIDRRIQKLEEGANLDWATAEALAIGSLLYQGYHVRLSGQDVGRGTFSQRHAMFVDQKTDGINIPLNNIDPQQQGFYEVCNSILSEEAVLGFEYGVSIENPNILAIWEAQFGDFFTGAQIMIDTYIVGGEAKWLLQSGLVMLLPHGMDGTGPEHSSCRLERFLQLSDSKEDRVDGDSVNVQVVNPTTPAQYFHLLRRQMVRNFRKPLIVAAPKLLLRHPSALSDLGSMAPGTSFLPVLGDPIADPAKVTRVIFMSGKHYYTLAKEREDRGLSNIALVRLESLSPFPVEEIRTEMNKYSTATDFVWAQEEHRNQGAWSFVNTRFENVVGKKLRYAGRDVHPTPATGIGEVHKQECRELIHSALL